jgi:hypothetical protein
MKNPALPTGSRVSNSYFTFAGADLVLIVRLGVGISAVGIVGS